MDVFADADAKARLESSLARTNETTKAANDAMLKAYEAYGRGETELSESYVAYVDDVLHHYFDVEPTADGKGYTGLTARQKMEIHRMNQSGEAIQDDPIGTEAGGQAEIASAFLSHALINNQDYEAAISDYAKKSNRYGNSFAEVKAVLDTWDLDEFTEAMNASDITQEEIGYLEDIYFYKSLITPANTIIKEAEERTRLTLQSALLAGERAYIEGGPNEGSGIYAQVVDGQLVYADPVTKYEVRDAYDVLKEAEYDRRRRPWDFSQGQYGSIGGWLMNRAVDGFDLGANIISSAYDFVPGRVTTGGYYMPSYKGIRVSRNMRELYYADDSPGKRKFLAVAGYEGLDEDGDGIPDEGATSGTPVYGDYGLVAESQKSSGTRFREELGKGIFTAMVLFPGLNVGGTKQPALGATIGGVTGKVTGRVPYLRRVFPAPGRASTRVATRNIRKGEFLPGQYRVNAPRNIAKGQRIPGGGGRTYPRDLLGLTTGTVAGAGVDMANVAYSTETRQQRIDEMNRRGAISASPFVISQPSPSITMGALKDINFFRRGLREKIMASGITGDDASFREGFANLFALDFLNSHEGSFFINGTNIKANVAGFNLTSVIRENEGKAIPTGRFNLNRPEARVYLDEILSTVLPDGSRLFPDIPELQSGATFTASQEGDPTKDEEAILLDVVGIGGGNLRVEMVRGDDEPMSLPLPIGKNTKFYKEVVLPEIIEYSNAHDNMYANIGNFMKSKQLIAEGATIAADGTVIPGSPLTNKLRSVVMYDTESGVYIRPEYTMTYIPDDDQAPTRTNEFGGDKVLRMVGVTFLDENNNVLGFVDKAGPYKFNRIIGETIPNSLQNPNMPQLLYNVKDNDLSMQQANEFFNNTDMVKAAFDEFSKSN